MKFKIVAEHKGKKVVIPLSNEEVSFMGDVPFIIDDVWDSVIKPNKWEKVCRSTGDKFLFLLHDVKHGGKTYEMLKDKKGKITGKTKLLKKRHYLVKKPEWV